PRLTPASTPRPPPAKDVPVAPASASAAPAGATSGPATCQGTFCVLGDVLPPGVPRVCLDAPRSREALYGVQPVCTLLYRGGISCVRSDRAASAPLDPPITWRLCP